MNLSTKKISELENLNSISNSDLLETTSLSSSIYSIYTSKKTTIEKFGIWLCSIFSFSQQLQTLTKTIIKAINEIFNKDTGEPTGAGFHNSIYRGKWLGTTPTEEQMEAINNGTFTNLFIGDYWSDNSDPSDNSSIKYRIAAFDYYYGIGETPCLTHHAVIVPDKPINRGIHNGFYEKGTTRGGYKYAWCRGYEDDSCTYITTEDNQTIFNISTYVPQGSYVAFVVCVYMDDPTISGQYIIWDVEEPSGNDNIIKIKGNNYYHATNASSTFSGGIPNGTQINIYFKYKIPNDTYYSLNFCEYVITETFVPSNYIMNFPLLATVDSTNQPGLITTEWTKGRVEFMTEQQVMGARTIGVNYNFESDILFINNQFQYNRKRFETTVDSIQFPLFRLHPGMRQNYFYNSAGSGDYSNCFWLRDRSYESNINWTNGLSSITDPPVDGVHSRFGGSYMDATSINYNAQGIKPYFCLAKPQS